MNATAASVVSNKGGESCVVRSDERELLLLMAPGSWLLLCSAPARPPSRPSCCGTGDGFLGRRRRWRSCFKRGDMLNACGRRKGDMTLACCAWAIVPIPIPTLLQPRRSVSAFKQATDTAKTASLAGSARQERGLRRPSPSLAYNVSVIASWVRRLPARPACLPACLPYEGLLLTVAQGGPDPSVTNAPCLRRRRHRLRRTRPAPSSLPSFLV